MITIRCVDCRETITIKKEHYCMKDKFVCWSCSERIIIAGIRKYGKAYYGGANFGHVEILEFEAAR